MSFETRPSDARIGALERIIGLRRWLVALAGCVLAAASIAPSAALAAPTHERVTGHLQLWNSRLRQTPTETIDAQKDPQAAGDALNSGCADMSKCSWQPTTNPTIGWGPPQILGDALYNCSDTTNENAYSEAAVGIEDEREETTSISETLTVDLSLGFLGLEKSTAEFEVFTKQSQTYTTGVTNTNAVSIPPQWKGWTETRVLTAFVTGDAYITAGINKLIEVKGIDLNFPGFQAAGDTEKPVQYIGYKTAMTADDLATYCAGTNSLGGARPGASAPVRRLTTPKGSFKVTLCALGSSCATQTVTGTRPPVIPKGTVTLTRGSRTYATGTDTSGRIQLTAQQAIGPGNYTLTTIQQVAPPPGQQPRAQAQAQTLVPISIR
jgi:hypothetical protein